MEPRINNFYERIFQTIQNHGKNIALETEVGRRLSYDELDKYSGCYGEYLSTFGLKKGDRVLVQVQKCPEALFLYLACLRRGFTYVPVNIAYLGDELRFFIEDCSPALIIGDAKRLGLLKKISHEYSVTVLELAEIKNNVKDGGVNFRQKVEVMKHDDTAVLIYTSGTTGRPKGAKITHHGISSNASALVECWEFSENDTLLHSLPIFHIHGLFVATHCSLVSGAKMLWLNSFNANRVNELLSKVTVFMGVPTHYHRLLKEKNLSSQACERVRLFISGSAPLMDTTQDQFLQRTGHLILERYGMSEAGIIASTKLKDQKRVGTVGKPVSDYRVRIIGEDKSELLMSKTGSVEIKGRCLFSGYWRAKEKTKAAFTEDGWFRTGDLGFLDAQGHLTIVGREKDMIISGGYNVYPREVEQLMQTIEGIEEVAVVGKSHSDFGEQVVAVIVLKESSNFNEYAVKRFLKHKLANYKIPKRFEVFSELPRNAMGKIQKNLIKKSLAYDD